jgi:hypothetical protein
LGKLKPVKLDLSSLIRFARGHAVEKMVRDALLWNDVKHHYQLEASHPKRPFKVHVDFAFENTREMAVLEVKSVGTIPPAPYDSWLQQIHFQMGLVADEFGKPVRGAILAIDYGGKLNLFNGFSHNLDVYEGLLAKADHIWSAMQGATEPTTEKGPLCSWCHYRFGCPGFPQGENIPSMPVENEVEEYLGLKEQKKELDARLNRLKDLLMAAIENGGAEGKIKADSHILTLSERSRTSAKPQLKSDHPDIFKHYTRTTKYQVLLIN